MSHSPSCVICIMLRGQWLSCLVLKSSFSQSLSLHSKLSLAKAISWNLTTQCLTVTGGQCLLVVTSPCCECGQRQTMNHIVDMCPLTEFKGGLKLLNEADDYAGINSDH